jgi:hypothetical protein
MGTFDHTDLAGIEKIAIGPKSYSIARFVIVIHRFVASPQQRQQQVAPTDQPAALIPRDTIACVIITELVTVCVAQDALGALYHDLADLVTIPVA